MVVKPMENNEWINDVSLTLLQIVSILVVVKGTRHLSYPIYRTLYNPILSDQFGFTERDQAYFFFALVVPQFIGAVLV